MLRITGSKETTDFNERVGIVIKRFGKCVGKDKLYACSKLDCRRTVHTYNVIYSSSRPLCNPVGPITQTIMRRSVAYKWLAHPGREEEHREGCNIDFLCSTRFDTIPTKNLSSFFFIRETSVWSGPGELFRLEVVGERGKRVGDSPSPRPSDSKK